MTDESTPNRQDEDLTAPEADERTAGPAEELDPGNDNPATNAPVE